MRRGTLEAIEMADSLIESIASSARDLAVANRAAAAVFCYASKDFHSSCPCEFCTRCGFGEQGKCSYITAHQYGCYEAERFGGSYIYYCPARLIFFSAVIYNGAIPVYAFVTGPFLSEGRPGGIAAEDKPLKDEMLLSAEILGTLPRRSWAEIQSLSNLQRGIAIALSGNHFNSSGLRDPSLLSSYKLTESMNTSDENPYPVEIENKLIKMIVSGSKDDARRLINELLGKLYFGSNHSFLQIKLRAQELVVLFSRASIEGGADVKQIFGKYHDYILQISYCESFESLSDVLTVIFNRFVSYVFDFEMFEHADIARKLVSYINENYYKKISLEDASRHVALSPSYLSTIFKLEFNTGFTEYVTMVRIRKSRELLSNPRLSLAEIADLVGYNDQSYFTKVFVKINGVSPGQYRKNQSAGSLSASSADKAGPYV